MTTINTPVPLPNPSQILKADDVDKILRQQFNRNAGLWTKECTLALKKNPHLLFLYDQLEYSCAKAFGSNQVKIMLNPLMMMCYHPSCTTENRTAVRLKKPCVIDEYLIHLALHTDPLGQSMFNRFVAMKKDIFCDSYDSIGASPFTLMQPGPHISQGTVAYMKKYGIVRNLNNVTYTCYWKDVLIKERFLTSQSLAFQEDDALTTLALLFPQPVQDWWKWKTIASYAVKMVSSIGNTALNLFRGITKYPALACHCNRKEFMETINHPCPSVSSVEDWSPKGSHENEQYHETFLHLHNRFLTKYDESVSIEFNNVVRYPSVLIIDEQELNQGSYIKDGVLDGLAKKLTPQDLLRIGLKKLPKYIRENCPFICSAREYRLVDLAGAHCSNVYTQFLSGAMKTEECKKSLKMIVDLANKCENCIKDGNKCRILSFDKQCQNCQEKSVECRSLFVFHNIWDMGSSHVVTAAEADKITDKSLPNDFLDSRMLSYGFGGLHLAKSPTNCLRNYSLTLNGENYGLHVIRALRNTIGEHTEVLNNLKIAVVVGKDRQSDLYSYLTTGYIVQQSLQLAENYKSVRVPEPVLNYTNDAKKQKVIVFPTGIQVNNNGDIFILDSGAASVFGVERSSVARMHAIGTKSLAPYTEKTIVKGSAMKLSNSLNDLYINMDRDDVFVVDSGRNEIVIVRSFLLAEKLNSSFLNVWKKIGIQSITEVNGKFICLVRSDERNWVEICDIELPSTKKTAPLFITEGKMKKIKLDEMINFVFSVTGTIIGMVSNEKKMIFHTQLGSGGDMKEKTQFQTTIKPQLMINREDNNCMVVYLPPTDSQLSHIIITCHEKKGCTRKLTITPSSKHLSDVSPSTRCFSVWGNGNYYVVSNINGIYKVFEYGPINFGLKFSKALNSFYSAMLHSSPWLARSTKDLG